MLDRIKNSFLYRCLHIIMIGYFSISSINIGSTFSETINSETELHSLKGMTCNLLKKIFKYDSAIEELEDFKTKDCKTVKLAKGLPLLDYIIPADAYLPKIRLQLETARKNYRANKIFSLDFHGRIHVPPPRMVV